MCIDQVTSHHNCLCTLFCVIVNVPLLPYHHTLTLPSPPLPSPPTSPTSPLPTHPQSSLPLLPPSLGEDKSPDDGKDKATAEEIGHIHLPIPSAVQVSHVETPPDSEDWFDGRWQTWTSAQKGKGRDSPHMHMLPRNPFEEYLLRSLAQRGSGPPPAAAQGERVGESA